MYLVTHSLILHFILSFKTKKSKDSLLNIKHMRKPCNHSIRKRKSLKTWVAFSRFLIFAWNFGTDPDNSQIIPCNQELQSKWWFVSFEKKRSPSLYKKL